MLKTNFSWEQLYAIYYTLLPHEKKFLGNHFIDSPFTVYRWIEKYNAENAGFIILYDMERPGVHKGELIITVAIWEKYRGLGLLQKLEEDIEQFVISSSKYDKLIWLAKDDNKKSIHCAEKLGYTRVTHELDHWVFIKKFPKDSNITERTIIRLNNQLNDYDYGMIVDARKYTDAVDPSKYTTIPPDIFEWYGCGTCWDYVEYEAKVFEEQFGFKFTLNPLKHDREFSLYYVQTDDAKNTHTWLAYRKHVKVYLFESSWKSQIGIKKYNTEEEMLKEYIKELRKDWNAKLKPIIVTKYKRNKKFWLSPKEFMRRCINDGKVIYSEINSIPAEELSIMLNAVY